MIKLSYFLYIQHFFVHKYPIYREKKKSEFFTVFYCIPSNKSTIVLIATEVRFYNQHIYSESSLPNLPSRQYKCTVIWLINSQFSIRTNQSLCCSLWTIMKTIYCVSKKACLFSHSDYENWSRLLGHTV